jgi:hypothetical protein
MPVLRLKGESPQLQENWANLLLFHKPYAKAGWGCHNYSRVFALFPQFPNPDMLFVVNAKGDIGGR